MGTNGHMDMNHAGGLVHLLSAPEGSLFWAAGMRQEIQNCRRMRHVDRDYLSHCLGLLLHSEAWRHLKNADAAPFRSFVQLCCAPPPHGLGLKRDELAVLLD